MQKNSPIIIQCSCSQQAGVESREVCAGQETQLNRYISIFCSTGSSAKKFDAAFPLSLSDACHGKDNKTDRLLIMPCIP